MELRGQDSPALGVLQAAEELADDPKARRHDPARIARMYPFTQHLDAQGAARQSPERGRTPHLLVVTTARVEADDQFRLPDARRQCLHIGGQIEAPALLAGLDEDHTAGVRHANMMQRRDGAQGREHRVAVVCPAPTVEPIALHDRQPRTEAGAPPAHLRLFVEVAVEQHRRGCAGVQTPEFAARYVCARYVYARYIYKNERRAAREPHHLDTETRDRLCLGKGHKARHHLIHVAVRLPFGIEGRGLVGDADVLDERGEDGSIPDPIDVIPGSSADHVRPHELVSSI